MRTHTPQGNGLGSACSYRLTSRRGRFRLSYSMPSHNARLAAAARNKVISITPFRTKDITVRHTVADPSRSPPLAHQALNKHQLTSNASPPNADTDACEMPGRAAAGSARATATRSDRAVWPDSVCAIETSQPPCSPRPQGSCFSK
jgi:hypothetical protein